MVGTWRGSDAEPTELFVNHQAGLAGHGGSSYIDTVVLRDKDNNGGGGRAASGDGTREPRHDYAQREGGWRADVSVIVDNAGDIQEWDNYRAYGVPFLLTPADHNKDGAVTKDDSNAFDADYAAGNLRADLDKSGTVTSADQTIFNASYAKAVVGGRWKLSAPDIANRKGYAGYEHDGDGGVPELAHVRYRVLHFGLGRWTRRDPLGYVDGMNIWLLTRANPLSFRDPTGECSIGCSRDAGVSAGATDNPLDFDPLVEDHFDGGVCSRGVGCGLPCLRQPCGSITITGCTVAGPFAGGVISGRCGALFSIVSWGTIAASVCAGMVGTVVNIPCLQSGCNCQGQVATTKVGPPTPLTIPVFGTPGFPTCYFWISATFTVTTTHNLGRCG